MANFTLYSNLHGWSVNDLWSIDFGAAPLLKISETTIAGYLDGVFVAAQGRFTLEAGELTGGTLANLSFTTGGDSMAVFSGLSLDIDDLASGAVASMFQKSDILTSSWDGDGSYATGGGDDRIMLGAGDDTVDGGSGRDTFVLDLAYDPQSIGTEGGAVLVDSAWGHDRLTRIERIEFTDRSVALQVGGDGRDILRGDSDPITSWDILFGGAGDDRLIGRRGADRLFGGDGDDRLSGNGNRDYLDGGAGDDILRGGGGRDTFVFATGAGHDRIADFQLGIDTIAIGDGAAGLSDLTFSQQGADVLISFADVTILVQHMTLGELQDGGNFDF
ncbi:MAG: calcium-binding protein [Pseudodonghicola sp.]